MTIEPGMVAKAPRVSQVRLARFLGLKASASPAEIAAACNAHQRPKVGRGRL